MGSIAKTGNTEQKGPILESPVIVKVSVPNRGWSQQPIPPWTKARWQVVYWWRSRWTPPNWKAPGWVATLLALWLAAGLAAITTAYFPEAMPAMQAEAAMTPAPITRAYTTAVPAASYAALSTIYVVQPGDTLFRIASRYDVSMAAIDQVNQLGNTISVGQVLVIPTAGYDPAGAYHSSSASDGRACAQMSFVQGRDGHRGALPGVYALQDVTGGQIAAWYTGQGALVSGWIPNLPISFASVHARVLFYPRHGGGASIQMEMVNPAPDTIDGWLSRGQCHSLEIQFPVDFR